MEAASPDSRGQAAPRVGGKRLVLGLPCHRTLLPRTLIPCALPPPHPLPSPPPSCHCRPSLCIAKKQPHCHYSIRLPTGPRRDATAAAGSRGARRAINGNAAMPALAGGAAAGGEMMSMRAAPALSLKR